MVAALGFLDAGEVLVKLVLLREGNAVDALEVLAAGVAAPVGGIAGGELDGVALDAAGGIQMRAGAEVGELALAVEADDGVLRQVVDQLDLIGPRPSSMNFIASARGSSKRSSLSFSLHILRISASIFSIISGVKGKGESIS